MTARYINLHFTYLLTCFVKQGLVTLIVIMILKDTATFHVLFIVSVFCAWTITTVEINSGLTYLTVNSMIIIALVCWLLSTVNIILLESNQWCIQDQILKTKTKTAAYKTKTNTETNGSKQRHTTSVTDRVSQHNVRSARPIPYDPATLMIPNRTSDYLYPGGRFRRWFSCLFVSRIIAKTTR